MDLTIGCSKDDALSLFPISKLICTNPPSLAAEQSLPLIHSDTDSNSALAGYWSFLITELGVHTGYILSNPTSPHFNRVDGKFTFQGGLIEESSRDSQLGGVNSYGPPLRIHGDVR